MRVVLLSGSGTIGRGVAYSTVDPSHLLNVPTEAMSAFPENPDDFVCWLDEHGRPDSRHQLVERALYGAYLEDRLQQATTRAASRNHLQVINEGVVDIETTCGGPVLVTQTGQRIPAAAVVLATGPQPPSAPHCCRGVVGSDQFIVDPWQPGALDAIGRTDVVTLIGTGLTCVDMVLTLARKGHVGPIYAFSRHGLLPHEHVAEVIAAGSRSDSSADVKGATAREVLHHIRALVDCETNTSVDWRVSIDRIRPQVTSLWERLPDGERRRFRRHAERFWDIHRHRIAPATARQVREMSENGRMHVASGHLVDVQEDGSQLLLTFSAKRGNLQRLGVHSTRWLVNCTGPSYVLDNQGDTLVSRLVARGVLRPGPLGLGIDATGSGRALDLDGNQVAWLWGIGPRCSGGGSTRTTAVPEIRVQARNLAHEIRALIHADEEWERTSLPGFRRDRQHGGLLRKLTRDSERRDLWRAPLMSGTAATWFTTALGERSGD